MLTIWPSCALIIFVGPFGGQEKGWSKIFVYKSVNIVTQSPLGILSHNLLSPRYVYRVR